MEHMGGMHSLENKLLMRALEGDKKVRSPENEMDTKNLLDKAIKQKGNSVFTLLARAIHALRFGGSKLKKYEKAVREAAEAHLQKGGPNPDAAHGAKSVAMQVLNADKVGETKFDALSQLDVLVHKLLNPTEGRDKKTPAKYTTRQTDQVKADARKQLGRPGVSQDNKAEIERLLGIIEGKAE